MLLLGYAASSFREVNVRRVENEKKIEPQGCRKQKREERRLCSLGLLLLWREQAEACSPRVCLMVEQHTWFGIG